MQFNVTKCHTMRLSQKKESVLTGYFTDVQKMSLVTSHPYLGSMLTSDLRWNSHVSNIVIKANKSLGFVKRDLYPCSESTKRSAYVTIIRPNLEYATAAWDPYQQDQIDVIEAVQQRAARFVKRDYSRNSVTGMLESLDLDPLIVRCKIIDWMYFNQQLATQLHCQYLINFYPNNVLINHFLNSPFYHQVAMMIIIFIAPRLEFSRSLCLIN